MTNIIVVGAGPAGMLAALRAAELGARTVLVARAEFGGMAANDGPIPVRVLSQAARLIREARELGQYGIAVNEPVLDYRRLLARVREVVDDVDAHIFVAATNAARGPTMPLGERVSPSGSFTDPEYAQVGLTEKKARETRDVVTAVVKFDSTTRTIIDGHKVGFCKLIVDRKTATILGCHVVGERAVDIVQIAAIVIAGKMRVDDLAGVPLSFPTYEGILVNAAASAAQQLGLTVAWQAHQVEGMWRGNSATTLGRVPGGSVPSAIHAA